MMDKKAQPAGRRPWGRRTWAAFVTIILVSTSFYVCLFAGVDLAWFVEYTRAMLFILGFVAGGLTITDAVSKWRTK